MANTNLVGKKYGRWLVSAFDKYRADQEKNYWLCICECGKTGSVSTNSLHTGHSQSCGCLAKERRAIGVRLSKTTHGHSIGKTSATYNSWRGMWARCTRPSEDGYKYYGARGITICDSWGLFKNFLSDMGEKPIGSVLDRINNDGNYEPTNCRWTDWSTSNKNKRRGELKLVA